MSLEQQHGIFTIPAKMENSETDIALVDSDNPLGLDPMTLTQKMTLRQSIELPVNKPVIAYLSKDVIHSLNFL